MELSLWSALGRAGVSGIQHQYTRTEEEILPINRYPIFGQPWKIFSIEKYLSADVLWKPKFLEFDLDFTSILALNGRGLCLKREIHPRLTLIRQNGGKPERKKIKWAFIGSKLFYIFFSMVRCFWIQNLKGGRPYREPIRNKTEKLLFIFMTF